MWSSVSKFLGISNDSEDEDDGLEEFKSSQSTNPDVNLASHELHEEIEEKEFDGVVTSLHSAYGLINNEIFFTEENVYDGLMPKVGDRVHVVTWRRGCVGGWRAKRVFVNLISADFASADANPCTVVEDSAAKIGRSADHSALLETKQAADLIKQELLMDKQGIQITEMLDFGQLLLGDSASLLMKISLVQCVMNIVFVAMSVLKLPFSLVQNRSYITSL
jgi:S1-like